MLAGGMLGGGRRLKAGEVNTRGKARDRKEATRFVWARLCRESVCPTAHCLPCLVAVLGFRVAHAMALSIHPCPGQAGKLS